MSFDGSNEYVQISNSNDINTGSNNHIQKTIEAWFNIVDKDLTSRKQTIYEQGGTTRGLNIYIMEDHYMSEGGMNLAMKAIGTPGHFYLLLQLKIILGTM